MKELLMISSLLLISCTKQKQTIAIQNIAPTYIQVEAVHEDGSLLTSKIILVR